MHLLMMALVLPLFFAIVVALGLYHAPGVSIRVRARLHR